MKYSFFYVTLPKVHVASFTEETSDFTSEKKRKKFDTALPDGKENLARQAHKFFILKMFNFYTNYNLRDIMLIYDRVDKEL